MPVTRRVRVPAWRPVAIGLTVAAVIGVVAPAAGFGCAALQQVSAAPSYGAPGTMVRVAGTGWSGGAPVSVYWDSPTGELAGSGTVDDTGRLALNLPVATLPAGVHYLVAVQSGRGAMTRAVAPFEVAAPPPAPPSLAAPAAATVPAATPGAGRSIVPAAPALGGAGLLAVFVIGLLAARRGRTRRSGSRGDLLRDLPPRPPRR